MIEFLNYFIIFIIKFIKLNFMIIINYYFTIQIKLYFTIQVKLYFTIQIKLYFNLIKYYFSYLDF